MCGELVAAADKTEKRGELLIMARGTELARPYQQAALIGSRISQSQVSETYRLRFYIRPVTISRTYSTCEVIFTYRVSRFVIDRFVIFPFVVIRYGVEKVSILFVFHILSFSLFFNRHGVRTLVIC